MAKITVMFGSNIESEHTLEKDEARIGRSMDCDIVVDNLGISRHHCSIVKDPAGWVAVDGGSNNGTFINGKKINRHLLKEGDRIVLGKHSLVFDATGFASATKTGKTKANSMGGEMTMFVDQSALAKAMAEGGKRMVISLEQGGREVLIQLTREETTVGSAADIPAKGFLVKPIQARIIKTSGGHRIRSESGWRSVSINSAKIVGERDLRAGDVIVIAGARLTYKQA